MAQDVEEKSHVLKLMQAGIDVARQTSLTRADNKPRAINPLINDWSANHSAADLPADKTANGLQFLVFVQRMLQNKSKRADQSHILSPPQGHHSTPKIMVKAVPRPGTLSTRISP